MLFFQNCDRTKFQLNNLLAEGVTNSASETDGNGATYGGKITYYHYIPGYLCENRSSPYSSLEYSPTELNSTVLTSKDDQCLSIPQQILTSEIDAGTLQHKTVGFGEKIFEVNSAGPLVVPESPIEIWCVDQWNAPTIEVLSLYNKSQNRAETQFYYPGLPKRSEMNPARFINQQTVRLTSSYFDLTVEKSQIGNKPGTFEGRLTINANSGPEKKLQCRLGSYLDARLWPAKAVNYDMLSQIEWNPLDGLFYTVTGNWASSWTENILSTYSADGTIKKILSGNSSNAQGVNSFTFSSDHSKLFLQAQLTGDASVQLYSLDPKNPAPPKRLNDLLTDFGQRVFGDVISSPTSDLVYYLDGAQETGADIEQWLRAVSLSTGKIYQINKNLLGADEAVGQHDVSYPLGKVVYSVGFVEHQVWISDMLGTNPRKIDLSAYLGSTYYIEWYVKRAMRWLMINDRYLVLLATSRDYKKSILLTIDLVSEKVVFSKVVGPQGFLIPVEGLPLVTLVDSEYSISYLDLTTNTLNTVEQTILMQKSLPSEISQQFATNLSVTTAADLCANDEQLISRFLIDKDRWLVIKKGNSSKSSLYLLNNNSSTCSLINHLVFPNELLKAIDLKVAQNPTMKYNTLLGVQPMRAKFSPDQRNLLIVIVNRLYLVPVDGHPVVEVYTPMNSTASFGDIGFINNSKIYFTGSVITNYVNHLFLWDVPKY
jgi:hypothetical protein